MSDIERRARGSVFFFTVNCFVLLLDVARGGSIRCPRSVRAIRSIKRSNSFFGSFVFRIFLWRTDDDLRILVVSI